MTAVTTPRITIEEPPRGREKRRRNHRDGAGALEIPLPERRSAVAPYGSAPLGSRWRRGRGGERGARRGRCGGRSRDGPAGRRVRAARRDRAGRRGGEGSLHRRLFFFPPPREEGRLLGASWETFCIAPQWPKNIINLDFSSHPPFLLRLYN